MARQIGCHCGGNPACKLCAGAGKYAYEPGPRGWMPFPCPTCAGARNPECVTCRGAGQVDPADPPSTGWGDVIRKAFFGST